MAGIDTKETMDSLFANLSTPKIADIPIPKPKEIKTDSVKVEQKDKVEVQPKWLMLDKVTVLLTTEQKAGLDLVAKKIMKYRSKELKVGDDKERITSNTLIRCLIDHFLKLEDSVQMEAMQSENDVHTWLGAFFNECKK